MKSIIKTGFIFIAVVISNLSCKKQLDDIKPQQSIDSDVALTTSTGVVNTLFGAYSTIAYGIPATAGTLGTLYGTNYNLIGELFVNTTDITWSGSFTSYRDINNKNATATNVNAANDWTAAYSAINICNNVEASIGVVDPSIKDQILGEARFIRGIVYFELIRFYAQPWTGGPSGTNSQAGVPLVLSPTTTIGNELNVSRNSVGEVYAQIIADLTSAESLLNETMDDGRATKYAAAAFLSRIYLAQEDWQKAATAANTVITSGHYRLVPAISQAFNNSSNSSEDIFAIQQNAQANAGTANSGLSTFYASMPGIGRGDVDINDSHLQIYETGDARGDLFYEGTGDKPGILRTSKWTDRFAVIPIVRLAEMHLTRAEANFRSGQQVGDLTPSQDINLIRGRSGLGGITITSVDQILLERRKELAFEGDLYNVIKRTRQDVGGKKYNDPKLIYPIPQFELDANPNLIQNPGY
ncbi:RagB/SusD family nutrient uptake outer membrane protein [Pedobacter sp. HMF7647]|uniref:RagB/SusD family nutrient uptake outer membrane protein n=1 Tax=Hufsiella arboris TaxID=2695275 RepID=A0A7K1Y9P2_9SPHI|nr:RagB/SusD family nutrient uptake outer membrane protein [Hufsiella arboris]MXV51292.1 RagB/SusD family nutrient uptake outer membrane protein [Hufsiella arboris]